MDVLARFVTCAVLAACLSAAGCSGGASTCACGTPVELPDAFCGLDFPGGDPAGADAPDRDGQGDAPPAEDGPPAADVPPDESPDLPADVPLEDVPPPDAAPDVPPADAAGEDTPVEDVPGADAPGDLPAQDTPVELPPCVPVQETCNDQDDDCNGVTDDGAADGDCDPDEICVAGQCVGDAVPVPAGPFWMGCNAFLDVGCKAHELPYRLVNVAKAYEIDVLEVTGDRYAAFLNAHGNVCDGVPCLDSADPDAKVHEQAGVWAADPGAGPLSVAEVSWQGARAFCEAAGRRLCTEAEWQKAARGGCELYADCMTDSRVHPWGPAAATCDFAVMDDDGGPGCGTGGPLAPGSRKAGASLYRALDMAGNMWEWVEDCYQGNHAGSPTDGSARTVCGDEFAGMKVSCGGGYLSTDNVRVSSRSPVTAEAGAHDASFRCCRSL